MSCTLNWSLLDEHLSTALRDVINAKIFHAIRGVQQERARNQADGGAAQPLVFLDPSAAAAVTDLWFGTEAPLLEILDVGIVQVESLTPAATTAAPTPRFASGLSAPNSGSSGGIGASHATLLSSPPTTIPGGSAGLSSASFGPATASVLNAAAVASPALASNPSFRFPKQQQPPPQRGSDESLSMQRSASSLRRPTSSAPAAAVAPPLSSPPPGAKPSILDAMLGPSGAFQVRFHVACNNSAGFDLATESRIDVSIGALTSVSISLPVLFTVSNVQFDVVGTVTMRPPNYFKVAVERDRFVCDAASGGAPCDDNEGGSVDPQQQLQAQHQEHSKDDPTVSISSSVAGAAAAVAAAAAAAVNTGGASPSSAQDEKQRMKASAVRILSSLSLVARIGGADPNLDVSPLVDIEHIQTLALRELRAILMRVIN